MKIDVPKPEADKTGRCNRTGSLTLYQIALVMAIFSGATGVFAQDETVNGNLKILGKTLELNGRRTHVLNYLSGVTPNPSTDSYRYEVARLCVNTYHWQQTGPIEVELRQAYWGASGYLKFVVTAGFGEANGSVTLLEKFGSALHANVSLGAPVATGTSFGGYPNQYIPVYVDLGNYTYWHVQLTHGWTEVADDIPTTDGRLKFFANPVATLLSGYVASPSGDARLGSRELLAGKIGIGTASPTTSLDVNGSLLVTGGASAAGTYGVKAVGADGADRDIFLAGAAGLSNGFTVQRVNNEMRYAFNHGNVGIGTTNPTHKLSVNGTVRAKEVIVDTGWADHVFKPDYQLASLSEVEGAIKRDGHLPGIPSAAEVAEHGVSMGEMQAKLLAKIEELTLYQIAQQKKLDSLESKNADQQAEIVSLRAELARLSNSN